MALQPFAVALVARDIFVHGWAADAQPKAVAGFPRPALRAARPAEDIGFFAKKDGWHACLDGPHAFAPRHPNIPHVFSAFPWARFSAERSQTA